MKIQDEARIRVEFYGVARQRTGIAMIRLPANQGLTLDALWAQLRGQFPRLDACDTLAPPMYRVNLDGHHFVTDPKTPIHSGQSVLIMSADAGG